MPRTELIGDTNRYVKEGSKVTLHCIVSGALDPPLYIFWFHGNEQIYPDNRRSWKTEINRNSLESDHTQSTVSGENYFYILNIGKSIRLCVEWALSFFPGFLCVIFFTLIVCITFFFSDWIVNNTIG